MTKMHIAILTRVLPHHSIGGMQGVAFDMAREMVRQGVAVTVLTTSIPEHPKHFETHGVKVVALLDTPPGRYSTAWWRASRHYFERHLQDQVSGVLSVSAAAYGLLPLYCAAPAFPFVFQVHGTSMGEVISKWRSRSSKVHPRFSAQSFMGSIQRDDLNST